MAKLTAIGSAEEPRDLALEVTRSGPVADRRTVFCLDVLGRFVSVGDIAVERSPQGLLLLVAEAGAASGRRVPLDQTPKVERSNDRILLMHFEFDPLDPGELAQINLALVQYGFCLAIGEPPGSTAGSIESACRDPRPAAHPPIAVDPRAHPRDIVYRADKAVPISVYAKDGGAMPWRLQRTETLMLADASSAFAIHVDPGLLIRRKMALVFDQGTLRGVESAHDDPGLIEIPLAVAKATVSFPSFVTIVRIGPADNARSLIDAQEHLVGCALRVSQPPRDAPCRKPTRPR